MEIIRINGYLVRNSHDSYTFHTRKPIKEQRTYGVYWHRNLWGEILAFARKRKTNIEIDHCIKAEIVISTKEKQSK